MSIFVSVEDKDGEFLSEVFDIARLQRHFRSLDGGVCLRFVSDDYDAFFNQLQLPLLLEELEALGSKELRSDEQEELRLVLDAVHIAERKRNAYVKFYGERGRE